LRARSASTDVVRINLPPPSRRVRPRFVEVDLGTRLVRIFDPTRRNTSALTFRSYGPLKRFDHHRGQGPGRTLSEDGERSVYYAASDPDATRALSSCLVEVFGDTGIVEPGDRLVAMPEVTRPLQLLDLRGHGSMRAGTVAAIAKCEYSSSQPWSRYFYETIDDYGIVDGLIYLNAHNDEPATMLYERAQDGLRCQQSDVVRLDDDRLRRTLVKIMYSNNLTWGD
jgi:hypothetical protein